MPQAAATAAGRRREPADEPVRIRRGEQRSAAHPQARPSGRARAAAAAVALELAPAPQHVPRPRPARGPRPAPGPQPARGPQRARPGGPKRERREAPQRGRQRAADVPLRQIPSLAGSLQAPRLDRIIGGRAWIPAIALMLVVVVGLRVEALKLGASVGSEVSQVTNLESSNAVLEAQISALSDNQRIVKLAAGYGMHMPNPLDVHFVEASAGFNLAAAIRNISRPSRQAFLTGLAAEQQRDALLTQAGSSLSAIGAQPTTPTAPVSTPAAGTAAGGGVAATTSTGSASASGAGGLGG